VTTKLKVTLPSFILLSTSFFISILHFLFSFSTQHYFFFLNLCINCLSFQPWQTSQTQLLNILTQWLQNSIMDPSLKRERGDIQNLNPLSTTTILPPISLLQQWETSWKNLLKQLLPMNERYVPPSRLVQRHNGCSRVVEIQNWDGQFLRFVLTIS